MANNELMIDDNMGHWLGRIVVSSLLALVVSACGLLAVNPSEQVITQAIALQLNQTQQVLSQQLAPRTPKASVNIPAVDVSHVHVSQRLVTQRNATPLYRIIGTCTIQTRFPEHTSVAQDAPFEIYMQPGASKNTWQLIRLP